MFTARLCLALFSLSALALGASQTLWSGDSGIMGPVVSWTDDYYSATDMSCSTELSLLQENILHIIDSDAQTCQSLHTSDIDGDGNMDVVVVFDKGSSYHDIVWWENTDGTGTSWLKHTIAVDIFSANQICACNIDGDGDIDVVGVGGSNVYWWQNVGGSGTSWTEHVVDSTFQNVSSLSVGDYNADSHTDISIVDANMNDIYWYQNDNGSGTEWTKRSIDLNYWGGNCLVTADIDGDWDLDVMCSSGYQDQVKWWENANGIGTSWTIHTVGNVNNPADIYVADIDNDGHNDVAVAGNGNQEIIWWENVNGIGTSWTKHTVLVGYPGNWGMCAKDIDGDNDIDIAATSVTEDKITWWENINGLGTSWTEHPVDYTFDGPWVVYIDDIDDDGANDIIAGGNNNPYEVAWWNIDIYSNGELVSSILDTETAPYWTTLTSTNTTPGGTSVCFQVRSADNPPMGVWSDTLYSPCSLNGVLDNGDRYVQYKAILLTTNGAITPVLSDVTVSWSLTELNTESVCLGNQYLLPIAPNPSSGEATIRFFTNEQSRVTVDIYALDGRLIDSYLYEDILEGYQEQYIGPLEDGMYFVKARINSNIEIAKFVVIN